MDDYQHKGFSFHTSGRSDGAEYRGMITVTAAPDREQIDPPLVMQLPTKQSRLIDSVSEAYEFAKAQIDSGLMAVTVAAWRPKE